MKILIFKKIKLQSRILDCLNDISFHRDNYMIVESDYNIG